nr:D-amino acid dehydrogenase small subunit [Bradyrhizobium sp. DOA9]
MMSALEIQRAGVEVVIVDAGSPGGRQAASYGNAGWASNAAVMPISVPGLWRRVPSYIFDKSGPFTIRWSYLPRLLPWLLRLLWAGRNWEQVEACARVRFELCRSASADHVRISAEAGVAHLVQRRGLLLVCRDRSEILSTQHERGIRRQLGIESRELSPSELRRREPNLSSEYRFGFLNEDGCHISDLGAYCEAIADLILRRGGRIVRARATGFETVRGEVAKVLTDGGAIGCTHAVVAAGIGSKRLAAIAGDYVSLESERGYHVVFSHPGNILYGPIMPIDGKMAITPTLDGFRIAGQVELASEKALPDWRRADILAQFASRLFREPVQPGIEVDRWMGHRPSTPDGLPCIGPASACGKLYYAFGHGHSGVAHAPATGKLVADLVLGRKPDFDISPLSIQRFKLFQSRSCRFRKSPQTQSQEEV